MKRLLFVVMIIALVGCSAPDKKETKKENNYCGDEESTSCKIDGGADMNGYENFTDKNNAFVASDMASVLSLIERKESANVYFGYPDCPWCVEAIPVLNKVAKELDTTILYVQTRDKDKNLMFSEEEKLRMVEYSDKFLDVDDEGNKQLYVPFVVVIKEGNVVDGHIGTVDGYDVQERNMNDEEVKQLTNVYKTMLKK